jgi:hypothetical protein
MGRKQFIQEIGGSDGDPVATSTEGVIETDNYSHIGTFDHSGGNYPYTVDPAEVIQEINFTAAGDIVAVIHTTGGDSERLALAGVVGSFDKWEITKIVLEDPKGTSARVAGGWAGE